LHIHKYPSIPNLFEKTKTPNTGTRYRHDPQVHIRVAKPD